MRDLVYHRNLLNNIVILRNTNVIMKQAKWNRLDCLLYNWTKYRIVKARKWNEIKTDGWDISLFSLFTKNYIQLEYVRHHPSYMHVLDVSAVQKCKQLKKILWVTGLLFSSSLLPTSLHLKPWKEEWNSLFSPPTCCKMKRIHCIPPSAAVQNIVRWWWKFIFKKLFLFSP